MLFDHHRYVSGIMLEKEREFTDKAGLQNTTQCSPIKILQLDPVTGQFTKSKNPGALYGQLTRGRSVIAMHARLVLARAVTVAVRYLSIRRQFHDRDDSDKNGPEMSVLDYLTVQIRILPLLATTFALHYSGLAMRSVRTDQEQRRRRQRHDRRRQGLSRCRPATLAELHPRRQDWKSSCDGTRRQRRRDVSTCDGRPRLRRRHRLGPAERRLPPSPRSKATTG